MASVNEQLDNEVVGHEFAADAKRPIPIVFDPVIDIRTAPAIPKRMPVVYRSEQELNWPDWIRRCFTVATILIAGFCFYKALPASWYRTVSGSRLMTAQPVTERRLVTRDIQDYDVGMRAMGTNPLRERVDPNLPEPDPVMCRKILLRMTKESGRLLLVKLLRDLQWIEDNQVSKGSSFFLNLPEMGAIGDAFVEAILPCPLIEKGAGNVVTGTFAHEADPDTKILAVTFTNGAVIGGVTDNHPFYSVDRHDYVPIGDMHEGDFVKVKDGVARISKIQSRFARPGELLYNLETHNEHVYQVTTTAILVHNSCALGRYADDGGHHVFAKRAFEGVPRYNPGDALAIGQGELRRLGLKHLGSDSLTTTQQRLFRELAASGRLNTLAEHARIARETLIEHGVDPNDAASAVRSALNQLKSWGISAPIHIPWGG